jgi:hypothetical protein
MSIIYRDRVSKNRYTVPARETQGLENAVEHIVNKSDSARYWSVVRSAVLLGCLIGPGQVLAQNAGSSDLEPLPPGVLNPPEKTSPPATVERLQIEDIRQLIREGLDEQIITQMVRERGIARPLLVGDLVTLRRAGVSNELIKEIQKAAPKAKVYVPADSPTPVTVYETPPPVIVRPAPYYYYDPGPHIYLWPSYHHHPPMPPHHGGGGGRVSFGFSF